MQQIDILDEFIGSTEPDRRTMRAKLNLDLETITAAYLIRFRIEDSFERGIDDPMLATRTASEIETTLNQAPTTQRGFSGVPETELARIGAHPEHRDARIAEATEVALTAFDAGAYLLIVNDEQIEILTQRIPLKDINEACFIRLLPLQGG